MPKDIIDTVLQITQKKDDEVVRLKIDAYLNEILSYLNRDSVDEAMFPVVCLVIADCITNEYSNGGKIQSLSEGDMSISYFNNSPFFGRLESFKLVKGIG